MTRLPTTFWVGLVLAIVAAVLVVVWLYRQSRKDPTDWTKLP
jgi:hypothetical protein